MAKTTKRFDVVTDKIAVEVHNSIMSMYASDEQLAALRDVETRPATATEIELSKIRRCKYY